MNFADKESKLTKYEDGFNATKKLRLCDNNKWLSDMLELLDIEKLDLSLRDAAVCSQTPELIALTRPTELHEAFERHKLACSRVLDLQQRRIKKLIGTKDDKSVEIVDLIGKSDTDFVSLSSVLHSNLRSIQSELIAETHAIESELILMRKKFREEMYIKISTMSNARQIYEEEFFSSLLPFNFAPKPVFHKFPLNTTEYESLQYSNIFQKDEIEYNLLTVNIKNTDLTRMDNILKSRVVRLHEYREKVQKVLIEKTKKFKKNENEKIKQIQNLQKTFIYLSNKTENDSTMRIVSSNNLEIDKLKQKLPTDFNFEKAKLMKICLKQYLHKLERLKELKEDKESLLAEKEDLLYYIKH